MFSPNDAPWLCNEPESAGRASDTFETVAKSLSRAIPDPDEMLERNIAMLRDYLSGEEAQAAELMLRRKHAERKPTQY